jgi:hypothetical protein
MCNGEMNVSPPKSGDRTLSSTIEKKIARTVKKLRRLEFPVFPEEVMKWAAEEMID